MRRYKFVRDISIPDAFRINWQNAVKEAEEYSNANMNNPSFDEKMKAVGVLCDVKFMYSKDDIDGYLRYLDKYRDVLKKDTYSQAIGSVDVPLELELIGVPNRYSRGKKKDKPSKFKR